MIYNVHSSAPLTGAVTNEVAGQANRACIHTDTGVSFVQPGGEQRMRCVVSAGQRGARGSLQQQQQPEDAE